MLLASLQNTQRFPCVVPFKSFAHCQEILIWSSALSSTHPGIHYMDCVYDEMGLPRRKTLRHGFSAVGWGLLSLVHKHFSTYQIPTHQNSLWAQRKHRVNPSAYELRINMASYVIQPFLKCVSCPTSTHKYYGEQQKHTLSLSLLNPRGRMVWVKCEFKSTERRLPKFNSDYIVQIKYNNKKVYAWNE